MHDNGLAYANTSESPVHLDSVVDIEIEAEQDDTAAAFDVASKAVSKVESDKGCSLISFLFLEALEDSSGFACLHKSDGTIVIFARFWSILG